MAENSKIEWTHPTFNPWIGCTKVGPGCDHCYAEALATARLGVGWGNDSERRRTRPSTWKQPRRWNKRAAKNGVRERVFCASLADVFDNRVPAVWRFDLFDLIHETPHLDWLLVTKRIGNAEAMARAAGGWPENVWLGATIVNQVEAERDIPKLAAIEGPRFRFLSMEPLLGPVSLEPHLLYHPCPNSLDGLDQDPTTGAYECCSRCDWTGIGDMLAIDWVIVGGEDGPRPMHPAWARSLRDECSAAGVPFLFKQWGHWAPVCAMSEEQIEACYHPAPERHPEASRRLKVKQCVLHADGARFDGEAMYHRPAFEQGSGAMTMMAISKKNAGRLLDGVEHNGYPATAAA